MLFLFFLTFSRKIDLLLPLIINEENHLLEMLNVPELRESQSNHNLNYISGLKLQSLVGFSCFRHLNWHLLAGTLSRCITIYFSLSQWWPTGAQNSDGWPLQQALLWRGTDISRWKTIRCRSLWHRRPHPLCPSILHQAWGRQVCCKCAAAMGALFFSSI